MLPILDNLWLEEGVELKNLLKCIPPGAIRVAAENPETNIHKIVKSLARWAAFFVTETNNVYKGFFIQTCTTDDMLERWMEEYNLPNEIFRKVDFEETRKDIYCLKYLMKGQTFQHFKAVANLYDINLRVINHNDGIIEIQFTQEHSDFPLKFPHKFGLDARIEKIKKIYDIMKEPHIKFIYGEFFEETEEEKASRIMPEFRER